MDLRIAYEDEHLLVVDKPAGLVVHPAPGTRRGTLVHGLLAHDVAGGDAERPGIVHRLDRDTSGLMVVARSEEAHRRLQHLVRSRELERHYLALVVGRPRSRIGPHRGADRARPPRPVASAPSTPTRHARPSRTSRSSSCSRGTRSSTCGSRRGGRTRSASTSRRSTSRSRATRLRAPERARPRAPVPPRRAPRLPASVHGCTGGVESPLPADLAELWRRRAPGR